MTVRPLQSNLDEVKPSNFLIILFVISGCSTSSKRTSLTALDRARSAVEDACAVGLNKNSVKIKGKLWLRIDAHKHSIQLPATFNFDGEHFVLDVGTLLGGTVLQASGSLDTMTVVSSMHSDLNATKVTEWIGVPVRWMSSLIVYGLVCPNQNQWQKQAWYSESDEFMVEAEQKLWAFHLVEYQGHNRIDQIRLLDQKTGQNISYKVEDWDANAKVRRGLIETTEGKFGWSWRSREQ